jgi:hypothetical protein
MVNADGIDALASLAVFLAGGVAAIAARVPARRLRNDPPQALEQSTCSVCRGCVARELVDAHADVLIACDVLLRHKQQ